MVRVCLSVCLFKFNSSVAITGFPYSSLGHLLLLQLGLGQVLAEIRQVFLPVLLPSLRNIELIGGMNMGYGFEYSSHTFGLKSKYLSFLSFKPC